MTAAKDRLTIYNEMEAAEAFGRFGPGHMFEEFGEHFTAQGKKTAQENAYSGARYQRIGLPVYASRL